MKGVKNQKNVEAKGQIAEHGIKDETLVQTACFYLNNKGIDQLKTDIINWCGQFFTDYSIAIVTSQLKPSFFQVISDLQSSLSNIGLVFIIYDPDKKWIYNKNLFNPKRDTPRVFGVVAFDNQLIEIFSKQKQFGLAYAEGFIVTQMDKNILSSLDKLPAIELLKPFKEVELKLSEKTTNGKPISFFSLIFNEKGQIKNSKVSLIPNNLGILCYAENCETGDVLIVEDPIIKSFFGFIKGNFISNHDPENDFRIFNNPNIKETVSIPDIFSNCHFFLVNIGTCFEKSKHIKQIPGIKDNKRKTERQNFLDASEIVYFATDAVSNITYLNRAWKKITGFNNEETIGQSIYNFINYKDKKKSLLPFDEPQASTQTVTEQVRINTVKGIPEWVNISFGYIFDEDGNFSGTMGTIQKTPVAQPASTESSGMFYQAALDNVSDLVFTINEDLKITFINKALLTFFKDQGLNLPVTGRKLINLYPLLGDKYEQEFRNVLHSGQVIENEKSITINKQEITFLSRKSPIMLENRVLGVACSMKNVSYLKDLRSDLDIQKASIEKDLSEKTRLLATMSHEIRTPMNGVNGLTELLLETKLSREQRHLAESIKSSSESLLGIINDVLDYSRIESGKMQLQKHKFSIATVLDEIFDLFSNIAREKGLELTYYLDPKLPDFLVGDSHRFRQIMINLIGNAVKFTSKGNVEIEVYRKSEEAVETTIEVSVKDTGIGISRVHIEKLFMPFSQLNDKTENKLAGSGLGLAITKSLVEIMGGKISVNSIPGKGSTFSFTTQFFNPGKTTKQAEDSIIKPKTNNIILYSSNHTIAKSGKRIFELAGYHCARAASLAQLKQLLETSPLEKILIWDVPSGKKASEDLFKKFTSLVNEYKIRIFLLSNQPTMPPLVEKMIEGIISKPLTLQKLKDIENILEQKKNFYDENAGFNYKLDGELAQKLPLKILIAEDDPVNQMLMKKILQYMGYKPDLAANGKQVIDLMGKRQYNLLFLDLKMPEMDGIETTHSIIEQFPVRLRPRIIACTANIVSTKEDFFIQNGFDDYIYKPINIAQVQKTIIKWGSKV